MLARPRVKTVVAAVASREVPAHRLATMILRVVVGAACGVGARAAAEAAVRVDDDVVVHAAIVSAVYPSLCSRLLGRPAPPRFDGSVARARHGWRDGRIDERGRRARSEPRCAASMSSARARVSDDDG